MKTATVLATILLTLALSACGSFAPIAEPASASTVVLEKEPASYVTPLESNETAELIKQLDKAGCDFGLVHITEGVTRKGSLGVIIECK